MSRKRYIELVFPNITDNINPQVLQILLKLNPRFKFFYLSLTLFSSALQIPLFANVVTTPLRNLNIIDSLVSDMVRSTLQNQNIIELKDSTQVQFRSNLQELNDNIEVSLLNNSQELFKNKTIQWVRQKNFASDPEIFFYINNYQITYEQIENEDRYSRKISFNVECFLSQNLHNLQQKLLNQTYSYQDEIFSNQINVVENKNYPFTKGIISKNESDFFSEFLEPIIITGTIAITIVLLFTVRSQ